MHKFDICHELKERTATEETTGASPGYNYLRFYQSRHLALALRPLHGTAQHFVYPSLHLLKLSSASQISLSGLAHRLNGFNAAIPI